MADWTSGQRSALLVEATTCFHPGCEKPATGLCVFGGHMICDLHQSKAVYKVSGEKKTQSPTICCGMNRPVWPNPFRAFYVEPHGLLLDHGQMKEEFHFQNHILTWKRPQTLRLRTWRFPGDIFPCDFHVDTPQLTLMLPVWRVLVVGFYKKHIIEEARCVAFWHLKHPVQILRDIRSSRLFATLGEKKLLSHPTQLFMFAVQNNRATCFCCRQETTLNLFAESACCLFSLAELEKCIILHF